MSFEWHLHLYTSYDYEFVIFFWVNIYILPLVTLEYLERYSVRKTFWTRYIEAVTGGMSGYLHICIIGFLLINIVM